MIAWLIKPVAKCGFFIHYYFILILVLIRNIIYLIYQQITRATQKTPINPYAHVHEHVHEDKMNLIRHEEYSFQQYEFQTQDHAFVSFWRVKLLESNSQSKPYPIIIQHGLLDCSMSWFLLEDKNKCLPYILAKQGFDVWVGNNRGTKYSQKNSHREDYWNYSIDHMIKYDQPTMIRSVLQVTGKQKLIYVGHSQGSTQFFCSTGMYPDLADKVHCFIGMGTVISLANVQDHQTIKFVQKIKGCQILSFLGFKTILILPEWMTKATGTLMYWTQTYFNIFHKVVNGLCGTPNKNNIDLQRLGVMIAHQPGGASINNCLHWLQIHKNKRFQMFDYGIDKNMEIYGQAIPPQYSFDHMKKWQFNSYIFKGKKDAVISNKDFNKIVELIPEQRLKIIELQDYAHLDYVWSKQADKHIYEPIVTFLKKEVQFY